QGVDGADLLAASPEPRELVLDLTAVGLGERLAGRLELLAEGRFEALELTRALVGAVPQLGGLDLGGGHRPPRVPQLGLEPEFLLGALAELCRDVAAPLLAGRSGELGSALLNALGHQQQGLVHALEDGQGLALDGGAALECLAVALPRFAGMLG